MDNLKRDLSQFRLLKVQKVHNLCWGAGLMRELSLDSSPEVLVSNAAIRREVARAHAQGRLRKLASRLYTRNLTDEPEVIVRRHLWPLVAAYFPGALIADRTALENKPTPDG